ncbi:MAG: PEP-CTERM sorting domain-containing protein [Planctomycetota bacterium]
MMRYNLRMFALCLMLACICKPANAELTLAFSTDNGENFSDVFDVRTGESLRIGVYLQQSGGETILTSEALVAWGFGLTRSPSEFGAIADAFSNPAFNFENHNVATTSGFEWEYGESAATGIRGDEILLGSFQFDAIEEGITRFTVEDRLVGSGIENASWFTSALTPLDTEIFGETEEDTFRFSVNSITAIPEPSGTVLIVGIGLIAYVRRRRRNREPI